MNIQDMCELMVENFFGAKHNLMFEGSPGIGKTAGVDEVANTIHEMLKDKHGQDVKFFYDTIILSTYESVDLRGIPSVGPKGTTVWNPADNLVFPPDSYVLLFWDELPNATQDVAKAVQQLIHSGRLGNIVLPVHTVHVAAGNRATDRAGANKLLTALGNRFEHHEIEPDVHQWSLWAVKKGLDKSVIAYANFAPNAFNAFNPAEKINPTPRTWEDVSEVLGSRFEAQRVMGCVGQSVGGAFLGFRNVWQELPKIKDIIADPEKAPVPVKPDAQHAVMLKLAFEAQVENYGKFMEYVSRYAKEMQVIFVGCSSRANGKLTEHAAFKAWLMKNKDVLIG